MNKFLFRFFITISMCSLFAGCLATDNPASYKEGVTRVKSDTNIDLSGYWNDTDLRIVAESLISDCTRSAAVKNYPATHSGKTPVVIVGPFKNLSDEHIDTSILTTKIEMALINSGAADFVADSKQRESIRKERLEQQANASPETAKALKNETGADYMLQGAVRTIVDSAKGLSTRTYYVSAELIDLESNKKLWIGENSEIKKVIKRSATRM